MRSEACTSWPSYPLICGGGRFDLAWKRRESPSRTSGPGTELLREVELCLLHRDQVVLHALLRGPVSETQGLSSVGTDRHWVLILDDQKAFSPQEAELVPYLIQEVERAASMNRIAVLRLSLPSAGLTSLEPEHWGFVPYAQSQAEQTWWAKHLVSHFGTEEDPLLSRNDWMHPLGQSSKAELAQLSGQ